MFLPGSLRCSRQCNLSCEKKSSYVVSGDKLAKLGALLKICLFTWDIGVLRDLIKRKNSQLQFYIFSRILRCPLWYLLASLENDGGFLSLTNWQTAFYSGSLNWSVLLSNWILWEVYVLKLFLAPEHLNSLENVLLFIPDDLVKKNRE